MTPATLRVVFLVLLTAAATVRAATTVNLPPWVCTSPDTLFRSGFQDGETVPHVPSNGSGGAYPGSLSESLTISGLGDGSQTYFLYVPTHYTPARAWPMIIALHGAGGPGTADSAAATVRDDWSSIAEAYGMIVVAPAGNGSSGGWIAPYAAGSGPTDYDMIGAARDAVVARYNVDLARAYLWGYSAGGHVAHDLVENGWNGFGSATVASYAVSAGVLRAVTCDVTQPALYLRPACAPLLSGQARRTPVQLHIGNSDPLLSEVQADRDRFSTAGWTLYDNLVYSVFVGGHTYAGMLDTRVWPKLCPYAVTP